MRPEEFAPDLGRWMNEWDLLSDVPNSTKQIRKHDSAVRFVIALCWYEYLVVLLVGPFHFVIEKERINQVWRV